jgi:hypothetical protein
MGAQFSSRSIDYLFSVAATTWPLTKLDKQTLNNANIHSIWLGKPFEEWCERQANDLDGSAPL